MEIDGLYDWESNTLVPVTATSTFPSGIGSPSQQATAYTCHSLCELVYPTTAKILMTYGSDFYKGYPALTCNTYENGKAYYLCAAAEHAFYQDFLKFLVAELFPERPVMEIPYGVEVTTRQNETREYLFLQNFTRETTSVSVSWSDYVCLTGNFDGTLAPYETVVLARNQQ